MHTSLTHFVQVNNQMAWRRRRVLKDDDDGENEAGLEYLMAVNETRIYMENLTKRIRSYTNESESTTEKGGKKIQ